MTTHGPEQLTELLQRFRGEMNPGDAPEATEALTTYADPDDFAALFGTHLGQKVLTQLCSMTFFTGGGWIPGQDPSHGYIREGQCMLVNYIIDQCNAAMRAAETGD